MSLDIILLRQDRVPEFILPLDVDSHCQIVELIRNQTQSLLHRMNDYYADAAFSIEELHSLGKDLDWVIICASGDKEFKNFLARFKLLVDTAIKEQKRIEVIAD